MTGASPIDGSSSRISFGRDISARPIASICCSPPERLPARWARRSFSTGKSVVHALDALREMLARRRQERAHLEVVGHGEAREEAPALGHVGDAVRDDLVRGPPRERRALEGERAGPRRDHAGDHAQQRGLPGPVGADDGHRLARVHAQRDVPQRGEVPVPRADARRARASSRRSREDPLLLTHVSTTFSPRYASITRGSSAIAAGGPSAIFSP